MSEQVKPVWTLHSSGGIHKNDMWMTIYQIVDALNALGAFEPTSAVNLHR